MAASVMGLLLSIAPVQSLCRARRNIRAQRLSKADLDGLVAIRRSVKALGVKPNYRQVMASQQWLLEGATTATQRDLSPGLWGAALPGR